MDSLFLSPWSLFLLPDSLFLIPCSLFLPPGACYLMPVFAYTLRPTPFYFQPATHNLELIAIIPYSCFLVPCSLFLVPCSFSLSSAVSPHHRVTVSRFPRVSPSRVSPSVFPLFLGLWSDLGLKRQDTLIKLAFHWQIHLE
jgi:hypothetical protein